MYALSLCVSLLHNFCDIVRMVIAFWKSEASKKNNKNIYTDIDPAASCSSLIPRFIFPSAHERVRVSLGTRL